MYFVVPVLSTLFRSSRGKLIRLLSTGVWDHLFFFKKKEITHTQVYAYNLTRGNIFVHKRACVYIYIYNDTMIYIYVCVHIYPNFR